MNIVRLMLRVNPDAKMCLVMSETYVPQAPDLAWVSVNSHPFFLVYSCSAVIMLVIKRSAFTIRQYDHCAIQSLIRHRQWQGFSSNNN